MSTSSNNEGAFWNNISSLSRVKQHAPQRASVVDLGEFANERFDRRWLYLKDFQKQCHKKRT